MRTTEVLTVVLTPERAIVNVLPVQVLVQMLALLARTILTTHQDVDASQTTQVIVAKGIMVTVLQHVIPAQALQLINVYNVLPMHTTNWTLMIVSTNVRAMMTGQEYLAIHI